MRKGFTAFLVLMLVIAMSPNEDEIRADAGLSRRLRAGASLAVRDSIGPAELTQPRRLRAS